MDILKNKPVILVSIGIISVVLGGCAHRSKPTVLPQADNILERDSKTTTSIKVQFAQHILIAMLM